jgi:hypothetical protein
VLGGLVVAAAVACGGGGDALASGRPYSVDDGDPVDVVLTDENDGGRCMTVSGTGYRRVASCFGVAHAEENGNYVLMTAESAPTVVVGFMPASATGATVDIDPPVRAEARGRWFLATLTPEQLASTNVELQGFGKVDAVRVDFDG